MNPDKSIVEFLCRDENLPLAIEVALAIDAIDEHVERRFLNLMHAGMVEKFKGSSIGPAWKLEKEIEQASKTRRYAGVYISPLNCHGAPYLFYTLVVCRESSEYSIYYGLEWGENSDGEPAGFPTEESNPLIKLLDEREFLRSKWTPAWKTIASFTNRKELLLTLHERLDDLARTAVDDCWAFVTGTVDMVAATNASLDRLGRTK